MSIARPVHSALALLLSALVLSLAPSLDLSGDFPAGVLSPGQCLAARPKPQAPPVPSQTPAPISTFRTKLFTLDLPGGWSLINGPFLKNGGETAVLGRRDRKAAIQMLYGPTQPGRFKKIAADYAASFRIAPPLVTGNQAVFALMRSGQKMHFLFRQDDAGANLVIFILTGNASEMDFIFTGFHSPHPGLAPVRPTPPAASGRSQGTRPRR